MQGSCEDVLFDDISSDASLSDGGDSLPVDAKTVDVREESAGVEKEELDYLMCVPFLAPRRAPTFRSTSYSSSENMNVDNAPLERHEASPVVSGEALGDTCTGSSRENTEEDDKGIIQAALERLFVEPPCFNAPTIPILSHLLQNHLGVPSGELRQGQQEVILSILQGQSTLAVFPTGWGKTVCFQIPILVHRFLFKQKVMLWKQKLLKGDSTSDCCAPHSRFGVVVSPLLSLMADQVARIAKDGSLKAVILSSSTSGARDNDILKSLATLACPIDLIFVSPERIVRDSELRDVLRGQVHRIAFVCIDEAHCVSQWAYDFRPSFMYVHRVLEDTVSETKSPPPLLCLTATATPSVVEDLKETFKIQRTVVVQYERANLQLEAVCLVNEESEKVSPPKHRDLQEKLLQAVLELPKPMLVYVQTRVDADELAKFLSSKLGTVQCVTAVDGGSTTCSTLFTSATHDKMQGSKDVDVVSGAGGRLLVVQSYHAALERHMRTKCQNQFMNGHIDVLVATVAFGMGIDKANIRSVVHASVPSSLESYVQEVGRAGRDGKWSVCRVLYDPYNFYTLRSRLLSSMVSPAEMLSVVNRIVSSPATKVGKKLIVVSVSKISEELMMSDDTVETVLFMILTFHSDILRTCHGISPTGYRVVRVSSEVNTVPIPAAGGKRTRSQQLRSGISSAFAQLEVLDEVLEMCRSNRRIENIVIAANALNMSLDDLNFRLNDLSVAGVVSLQRLPTGYVISVGDGFAEVAAPAGQQELANKLWLLHNDRLESLVKSLELTFAVLRNPTHDNVRAGLNWDPRSAATLQSLQEQGLPSWQPPARSLTKVEAVMTLNDFVEKNRSRINGSYEAARALLGILPKSLSNRGKYAGELPLALSWYVRSPHFGLLKEFDLHLILKLLLPHNLDERTVL